MIMNHTEKRIGNYAIEKFIGYGASSAVFQGYDLKCRSHGVFKRVAIKFIWDREMALDEVKRLEQTQSVFEICDLITYDEVPGSAIKDLIGETILQLENMMNCPLPIEDDLPVGMLILKLINGEHLIDRAVHQGEAIDPKSEWLLEFDHPEMDRQIAVKEWLTDVARELSLEERLDILLQLARAIDESHQRGVVHGDLNPWNVFYDRRTGRISIIDLGRNNFGVQGWRAPEHISLMLEEIKTLPQTTDVWLLGQWMRYLLPRKGPWTPFIERCQQVNASKRPNPRDILKQLKAFLQPRPKKRLLAVAGLFSLTLFAGIYALQQRVPFSMDPTGYNRIAVLSDGASTYGELVAEMVGQSLEASAQMQAVSTFKTRGLGKGGTTDLAILKETADSLGVQFVLSGTVTSDEQGTLHWNGVLMQRDGPVRNLTASGQNYNILSDQLTSMCLELLGSDTLPLPVTNFYSHDPHASFLYSYGNEFLFSGKFSSAYEMFSKAFAADPDFHWAAAKAAFCDFRRGHFDAAEGVLLGLVNNPAVQEKDDLLVTVYRYLSHLAYANMEYEQAIYYIEEAKAVDAQYVGEETLADLYSHESVILVALNDLEGARLASRRASEMYQALNDNFGTVNNMLLQIDGLVGQRELDEARVKTANALEMARGYGLENLEAILLKKDARIDMLGPAALLTEETLDKLQRARDIQVNIGDTYYLLNTEYHIGMYYKHRNEFGKADSLLRDNLRKARQIGDREQAFKTALALADMAISEDNFVEAEVLLLDLIDTESPSMMVGRYVYSRLGRLNANAGNFEKATEFYKRYLDSALSNQNDRSISYAYNNLGEVAELQGAYDLAKDYYLRSMSHKTDGNDVKGHTWTLRNLAMLHMKIGKMNQARSYIQKVNHLDPSDFRSLMISARFQYELGNFEDALDIVEKVRSQLDGERWTENLEKTYRNYMQATVTKRKSDMPAELANHF